jgi:hypothetical protein
MDEKDLAAGLGKNLNQVSLGFLIAAFFGFIRVLQDYIAPDAPAKFRWVVATVKTMIAGATGVLTTWLCLQWEIGPYMSGFLIAVAGYGGAETLQVFKEAGYDFIRRKAAATEK